MLKKPITNTPNSIETLLSPTTTSTQDNLHVLEDSKPTEVPLVSPISFTQDNLHVLEDSKPAEVPLVSPISFTQDNLHVLEDSKPTEVPLVSPFTSSIPSDDKISTSPIVSIERRFLKHRKDPYLNIETLKNHLLSTASFIYCDILRIYDSYLGYYPQLTKQQLSVSINALIPSYLKKHFSTPSTDISRTIKALEIEPSIQVLPENLPKNNLKINCLNGVISINQSNQPHLLAHTKELLFLNCINANYLPHSYSIQGTVFSNFINSITQGDSSLIMLIQQVLGYTFSNLNNAKKAFFLYGESNSGKSVFLNLISALCGEKNVSNVELQNLSDPQYTAELFGKSVNICSELTDIPLSDIGIFKALVSETDKVSARALYNSPFSFYNKAKLFFATNNLPAIINTNSNDNSAYFNRLIIIPFLNSIPEAQQDKCLFEKLLNEKDIIFTWSIQGLLEYIRNGYNFSHCTLSQKTLIDYKKAENPVVQFINDCCSFNYSSYIHMEDLYKSYSTYCYEQLLISPSSTDKKLLKSILCKRYQLEYKKINRGGKNKYGFTGISVLNT